MSGTSTCSEKKCVSVRVTCRTEIMLHGYPWAGNHGLGLTQLDELSVRLSVISSVNRLGRAATVLILNAWPHTGLVLSYTFNFYFEIGPYLVAQVNLESIL